MTKVNKDRDVYAQYPGAKPLTKAEEFSRRWEVLHDKAHKADGVQLHQFFKDAIELAKREEKVDPKAACEKLKTFQHQFKAKLHQKQEKMFVVFLRTLTDSFSQFAHRKRDNKYMPESLNKFIQDSLQQDAKTWKDLFTRLFGTTDEKLTLHIQRMEKKHKNS